MVELVLKPLLIVEIPQVRNFADGLRLYRVHDEPVCPPDSGNNTEQ